jgi:membrane associated rhomboid family serine protease
MRDALRDVDDIPVTLVVAIAYVTLAVVTGMLAGDEQFAERLAEFGWLVPMAVSEGEPWRLLAHAFLHGGPLHLVFNLMTLWAIGPALERSLGSVRYAALYATSAIGGALAVCLCYDPRQPVVGGSGALFGMMGAAVAMNMRSGRHVFAFLDFEGPRRLLGTIAVNLVIGFAIPFVSNTAHIGGLVTGFAVTFLWLRPGSGGPALRRWRLATTACLLSTLAWCLVPVTRFDWLVHRAEATPDRAQAERLMRAAGRAAPAELVRPSESRRR